MLPSETMIWQPEFTDKTLSRKPGAVQFQHICSHFLQRVWCGLITFVGIIKGDFHRLVTRINAHQFVVSRNHDFPVWMMLYNFLTKVFDESCPANRFSR
ncbi:hypothetical protein [Escherichia coli]|uniref:hypothetical protein n=1 Tax=Escherichia coli TaxID=562 RepID=UPI001179E421|nr:hypothetical protein [Escherichia coli]